MHLNQPTNQPTDLPQQQLGSMSHKIQRQVLENYINISLCQQTSLVSGATGTAIFLKSSSWRDRSLKLVATSHQIETSTVGSEAQGGPSELSHPWPLEHLEE